MEKIDFNGFNIFNNSTKKTESFKLNDWQNEMFSELNDENKETKTIISYPRQHGVTTMLIFSAIINAYKYGEKIIIATFNGENKNYCFDRIRYAIETHDEYEKIKSEIVKMNKQLGIVSFKNGGYIKLIIRNDENKLLGIRADRAYGDNMDIDYRLTCEFNDYLKKTVNGKLYHFETR